MPKLAKRRITKLLNILIKSLRLGWHGESQVYYLGKKRPHFRQSVESLTGLIEVITDMGQLARLVNT